MHLDDFLFQLVFNLLGWLLTFCRTLAMVCRCVQKLAAWVHRINAMLFG
jgi:hypothetical protein